MVAGWLSFLDEAMASDPGGGAASEIAADQGVVFVGEGQPIGAAGDGAAQSEAGFKVAGFPFSLHGQEVFDVGLLHGGSLQVPPSQTMLMAV